MRGTEWRPPTRPGPVLHRGSGCPTPAAPGCRVISIQKFFSHKRLNTTMVYARAYDQTMAEDYFAVMCRVQQLRV